MAGGDGSLAVVATAALTHGLPFVCIPAGTRNHFALDLGVDRRDVVGALGAFADGVERRIDVGMVNGRLFLNNVSLGVYADAVRHPAYRDAKLRTLLETSEGRAQLARSAAVAARRRPTGRRARPNQPSCWCRIIRTRSSHRRWRGRGRGWTARNSASSWSICPAAAGTRP
jgi:diacylglycerol kinase family enzyme